MYEHAVLPFPCLECKRLKSAVPVVYVQAEMTPIQVAAISGHRPIVKILLPVTAVLQAVEDWSVDGLFEHAKQLAAEVEV